MDDRDRVEETVMWPWEKGRERGDAIDLEDGRRDQELRNAASSGPWCQRNTALPTPSHTSDLQKGKVLNSCCFQPLGLWHFITTAIGNYHKVLQVRKKIALALLTRTFL